MKKDMASMKMDMHLNRFMLVGLTAAGTAVSLAWARKKQ
jgi:hypothetical protein